MRAATPSTVLLLLATTAGLPAVGPSVRVGPFPQQVATAFGLDSGLPSLDATRLHWHVDGSLLVRCGGVWLRLDDERWHASTAPGPADETVPVAQHQGVTVTARSDGLYVRSRPSAGWQRLHPRTEERSWGAVEVAGLAFDRDGGLWLASSQGVGYRSGSGEWSLYTTSDGLPYDELTAIAPGPAGDVWIGTRVGAIHFDGENWEYRQGRRWLPGDEIRDVAVAADGSAWFATDSGVGRIALQSTTLAAKAAHFEAEIDRYHRRTPFGYVGSVRLAEPGDTGTFTRRDSDNDGLWTSMYGAAQAFAYAATGSDAARARARKAFEALRFLGDVTQGGSPPARPGFVARSILPASGPDPNVGLAERDRRRRAERDARWKLIEPRWPKSAGGRWYWKCDTSSDELDGHYFFYALYHDLVAASDEERAEVRRVVRRVTDHLVEHDFSLVDHDGRPTRWAVFGPRQLNQERDWWEERGLNSLSILSYLRVAEHITGDSRYGDAARSLLDQHAYLANLTVPKIQSGPGTGNQSDDEMAFMSFYNLLAYETDPGVREVAGYAFFRYWQLEAPERNPLFHFLYAARGLGATYRDAFGEVSLDPYGDWLADSLDTLQRYPLDRVDWGLRNRHRKDLRLLAGSTTRGARRDGKVLPVDERFVDKWNHDPWRLDYDGDGRTLADGASFLLPYYLGLYHGFLVEPSEQVESRRGQEER